MVFRVWVDWLAQEVGGAISIPFDEKSAAAVSSKLSKAGMNSGGRAFLSLSLAASLLLSLALCAICSIAFAAIFSPSGLPITIALFLASFSLSFLLLKSYPAYAAYRRSQELERDLPLALRSVSSELEGGGSFVQSLHSVAKSPAYGELGREFSTLLREEAGGIPLPQALVNLSKRTDSVLVRRAAMQLSHSYQHGGGVEPLRKLSEELVALQLAASREFSSRLAFLTLVFVAISAVVPALFAAYATVGSYFLDVDFSPQQVFLAFAVLFPLLDVVLLLLVRELRPNLSVG